MWRDDERGGQGGQGRLTRAALVVTGKDTKKNATRAPTEEERGTQKDRRFSRDGFGGEDSGVEQTHVNQSGSDSAHKTRGWDV